MLCFYIVASAEKKEIERLKRENTELEKMYKETIAKFNNVSAILEKERKANEQKAKIHTSDIATNVNNQSAILSELAKRNKK